MTLQNFRVTIDGAIIGAGPNPLPGVPSTVIFGSPDALSLPTIVPLQPVSSQILNTTLNNQACTIKVFFKSIQVPITAGIPTDPPVFDPIVPCFLDLYVNDTLIIGGVIGQDRNRIVRDSYLGFIGDLAFIDTKGTADPTIDGLGTQFLLTYWPDLT